MSSMYTIHTGRTRGLPDTIDRRGLRIFFRDTSTDPRQPSASLVVEGIEFQLFVVRRALAYTAEVIEFGPWQDDLDGQGEYRHACEWPIDGFWPAAGSAYRAVVQLVVDEVARRRAGLGYREPPDAA